MSKYKLIINGKEFYVEILSETVDSYEVNVNGEIIEVFKESSIEKPSKTISSKPSSSKISKPPQNVKSIPKSNDTNFGGIKAMMPGKVLEILVKEGDEVESGSSLLVIESMKMENIISSNKKGIVKKINVKVNDNVQYDQHLIDID